MTDLPDRPYTIVLYSMGGQGGGGVEPMAAAGGRVLCRWIVEAAHLSGYSVQSTLTPGTGQRTGLNLLYIEIYPVEADRLNGRSPVLRLAPRPGDVDLLVAYELLEAGRAISQGLVSKKRTTLVASTHRFYTLNEKRESKDGRYDASTLLDAAEAQSKRSLLVDLDRIKSDHGGSINAGALGLIASLDSFPIPASLLEQAIQAYPDGLNTTEANLRAYAAARLAATAMQSSPLPGPQFRPRPALPRLNSRIAETFPASTHSVIREGVARLADYQNSSYARGYLDRIEPIRTIDNGGPGGDHALTQETARYLALWMSPEDIIRVADLKPRRERLARIRSHVDAREGEPLRVTEFFKPGIEEWAAILPVGLGRLARQAVERWGNAQEWNVALHIRSTSVWGYLLLRLLANMRFLRGVSLGRAEEKARIERWLSAIHSAARRDYRLAVEVAECAQLIKGYGNTRKRAYAKFDLVFSKLVQPALDGWLHNDRASQAVGEARQAAFADIEGRGIEGRLDEIAAAANADLAAAETGAGLGTAHS